MQPDDVAAKFAPWRQLHRRDAWRPVIGAGPSDSHFGGTPLLPAGEAWPNCPGCGRPMQLFLQLDLATLPSGAPVAGNDGVLQLFHCTSSNWTTHTCEAESETFEPFSPGALPRILPHKADLRPATIPADFTPFDTKPIVSWERFDDHPHPTEHDRLGLEYEYKSEGGWMRTFVRWPAGNVEASGSAVDSAGPDVAHQIATAAPKDKLGGWPHWVQGVEYPSCPQCGKEMHLLFQIDSEDHVPYMFGDVGCAHITQCPDHPDVLAFGWACC